MNVKPGQKIAAVARKRCLPQREIGCRALLLCLLDRSYPMLKGQYVNEVNLCRL